MWHSQKHHNYNYERIVWHSQKHHNYNYVIVTVRCVQIGGTHCQGLDHGRMLHTISFDPILGHCKIRIIHCLNGKLCIFPSSGQTSGVGWHEKHLPCTTTVYVTLSGHCKIHIDCQTCDSWFCRCFPREILVLYEKYHCLCTKIHESA